MISFLGRVDTEAMKSKMKEVTKTDVALNNLLVRARIAVSYICLCAAFACFAICKNMPPQESEISWPDDAQ